MFDRIPGELKVLNQWVLWKLEYPNGPDEKPTKVPYQTATWKASSTDPRTWATFDGAVTLYNGGGFDGIGFVLSDADEYAFIDLDKTDDPERQARQHNIYETFNSYSELSPSGNGLHIIVKGRTSRGVKRDAIELYSNQRFMTMTGNVYRDAPIEDRSELVDILFEEMNRNAQILTHAGSYPQRDDDQTVIDRASQAVNGEKFKDLHTGNWNVHYASQSEADFAYMDILAFYSQNRDQLTRIFFASPLGQRDKAKRVFGDGSTYVSKMIDRGFDRILPPIDIEGLRIALQKQMAAPSEDETATRTDRHGDASSAPNPAHDLAPQSIPWPPGLLGEVAEFIYQFAPRPVKDIALAAAIGFVAGVVGRAYNVSGTGINQYIQLVAMTGTGKEAMASGISTLINACTPLIPAAEDFVGPTGIASAPALIKHLDSKSPCFVSLVGESHALFARLTNMRATPVDIALKQLVLDLYNKSGVNDTIRPTVYSDRDKNTKSVKSPAFTILAESEPTQLFEIMDDRMVSSGLLPRFMFIEYTGSRPPLNLNRQLTPSTYLVNRVAALMQHCFVTMAQGHPINVPLTSEAELIANQFNNYVDQQWREAPSDVARHMWNRAHVKALKLAALAAVGIHPFNAVIDADCINWACSIAFNDATKMIDRFESGAVGAVEGEHSQLSEVRRIITEYITKPWDYVSKYTYNRALHSEQIIPAMYLSRRLLNNAAFKRDRLGATNAVNRAIKIMVESDELRELPKVQLERFNTTARSYMISNMRILGKGH